MRIVFLDGTWLYHSLLLGRSADRNDPILRRLGNWRRTHTIDWARLPLIIAENLQRQLIKQGSPRFYVEVVRTSVFTSQKVDPSSEPLREDMISDFYRSNFHVHSYISGEAGEKCVDIALAVDMLYMSTLPDALEVAVLCSGDKDFIPALQKCRLLAKKVAICSMQNSCNKDLSKYDANIRDFDVIWIEDFIDQLVIPKVDKKHLLGVEFEQQLLKCIVNVRTGRIHERRSFFNNTNIALLSAYCLIGNL